MQLATTKRKARVLFVDDEQRVLNSMRGMFRRKFDLFLTTEGAAAVRIASENPIDVIVADQRMPGMSGIEVLGKVKELSPKTIRILLTGYADPGAVEGSINVGEIFRFLNKPCPPNVLRDTLDLAISATDAAPVADAATPTAGPAVRPRDEASMSRTHLNSASFASRNRSQALVRRRVTDLRLTPVQATTVHDFKRNEDNGAEKRVLSRPPDVGVVVYTVSAEFAATAIGALAAERSITLATSLIKVMQTLEKNLAGVLVTDYTCNSASLQRIIAALKQYLPELVTIVVSDNRDTTDMINLINYGQVFRYIVRPVSPQQLRDDIDAAIAKHLKLRCSPEEIRRHAVARLPNQSGSFTSLNQVFG